MGRVGLDQAAQLADHLIHHALAAQEVLPPDGIEELLPGEHDLRTLHEAPEQAELERGQQVLASAPDQALAGDV